MKTIITLILAFAYVILLDFIEIPIMYGIGLLCIIAVSVLIFTLIRETFKRTEEFEDYGDSVAMTKKDFEKYLVETYYSAYLHCRPNAPVEHSKSHPQSLINMLITTDVLPENYKPSWREKK